jgi:hypothetical protein
MIRGDPIRKKVTRDCVFQTKKNTKIHPNHFCCTSCYYTGCPIDCIRMCSYCEIHGCSKHVKILGSKKDKFNVCFNCLDDDFLATFIWSRDFSSKKMNNIDIIIKKFLDFISLEWTRKKIEHYNI